MTSQVLVTATNPAHPALNARQSAWERDRHLYADIAANGGYAGHVAKLAAALPTLLAAARRSNGLIVCADERVNCAHEGNLADAGSTLLHSDELRQSFLERSGARAISWHTGCAAAAKAYELQHGTPPASADELNRFAEAETLRLAKLHNLEFAGRIDPTTCAWQGDHSSHFTRTLYWVVAPEGEQWGWSPTVVPGLPAGFTVMAGYLQADPDFAVATAQLLASVALGDHGYGDLITPEDPFYVVVVAGSQSDLEQSRTRLRDAFNQPHFAVDGFTL